MDINLRELPKTDKKYVGWNHKCISVIRDKNDHSIILLKIFKRISPFEVDIEYCVDIYPKKYFFDSLIDAEKFMQIEGGK